MANETKFKILVMHPQVPQEGLDLLAESCDVTVLKSLPVDRREILEKVKGMDGLYWAGHEPLNGEIIDAAGPQLKSVSVMSAGIDFVDVAEFKRRKIPLGHTPIVLNNAVAEMAVGLMLAASRRFREGRIKIETDTWLGSHLNWMLGGDIRDSTVGFFGFGGIGQTIAGLLSGFNLEKILYTTRHRIDGALEKKFNAEKVDFDTLLGQSDIVFITAPLTNETRNIFNSTAFAKMKKSSVLINVARGPIVDQKALYDALHGHQIFAAGLDVMDPEPLPSNDPLLQLPNLVLTPHLGSATERTRCEMSVVCAHNVLRGLVGEPMFSPAY